MKNRRVFALFAFLGCLLTSQALGAETKTFGFRAKTSEATANTTDILDGNYQVVRSENCETEVFEVVGKQKMMGSGKPY